MSNPSDAISCSPAYSFDTTQTSAFSPINSSADGGTYSERSNPGGQSPSGDDFPPPARKSEDERAKLGVEYMAETRKRAQAVARTRPVTPGASERPACVGYGPLENDSLCETCDWAAMCKPPPQRDYSVFRSRRRKAQRDFSKFFFDAHEAIYGTPAPNLYAVADVATRVQVVCLRERISPQLFLLFMLICAYETDFREKFRLAFLIADSGNYTEMRRSLVREHGSFNAQAICAYFERHDLIDRIMPLLPPAFGGTSADYESTTTLDQPAKHLFDRSVAKALKGDAAAAILYRNLRYWCDFYKKDQSAYNFHAGCYWRYDSLDALHEQFPYLSRSTIDRKLKKLRNAQYIDIDNFNKLDMDKTCWYHARKKDTQGKPIPPDGQIAFEVEEAKHLGSVVQACVLTVIRRRVKQNRAAGQEPEALLGTNDFMFLLPFTSRTIRRAITGLLKLPELGLRETEPPLGYAEERVIKRPRDRRWQPKIYSFFGP